MSFLGDLGSLASNAVAPAANVVAAHDQAIANNLQLQRAQAVQDAMMLRQQRQAENMMQLRQAQQRQANARADALENPASRYTYKTAADGTLYALPTSVPNVGSGAPNGQGSPVTPIATGVKAPTPAVKPAASIPGTPEYIANVKAVADARNQSAARFRPPPQQTITVLPGENGGPAQAVVTHGAPGTVGTTKALPGVSKVAPGGGSTSGFGSGGIGGVARQSAAISGLDNADQMMSPFEGKVSNKTANYDGLDYFEGMKSKMYDAKGTVDKAVHSAVYSHLNKSNPELATYLRAAEQWALEDSQLSGRPSDFRTKLDAFVSAIGPNATPEQIANVQNFRSTRLQQLRIAQAAMDAMMNRAAGQGGGPPSGGGRGGSGGGGGSAPVKQPAKSSVASKYGITPTVP